MRRLVRPAIVASAILLALAATAWTGLHLAHGSDFVFFPEPATPVAPVVHVAGESADPPAGGPNLLFVAIGVRRALLWEQLFGPEERGAALVPEKAVLAPGQSFEERTQEGFAEMSASQRTAAAVALEALGKPVGVRLSQVIAGDPGAKAGLKVGDRILAIDGKAVVKGRLEVQTALIRHEPGDRVPLRIARGTTTLSLDVATGSPPKGDTGPKRAFLGVQLEEILPVDVSYATKDVGGPSAGLAFALAIYDALTGRRLAGARRIAVTGEIGVDGSVLPIGGAAQKAVGASEAGASVFLVPQDDLAEATKAAPKGLRVIAVRTFADALRTLRGLPAATG